MTRRGSRERRSVRAAAPAWVLFFAFLLGAGLLAPGLDAQESPAGAAPEESVSEGTSPVGMEGEGLLGETVRVNVVNVEVYVSDRDGNRITGLTRDDFEIYEDRRPMTITNFYAVEGGDVVAGAAPTAVEEEAAPEEPPAPRRRQVELEPVPDEQRLHLVVYVDNFNIRPFNRNRVLRRVREFLRDNVRPENRDEVMLVSYDRSLNIRHGFTSDPEVINKALFDLETLTGHAVHYDSERQDLLEELDQAQNASSVYMRVRAHAESLQNDLLFTIDALKEFSGWLAGLPGRKAILYVSDGLPMRPAEDLFHALRRRFHETATLSDIMEFDASRRFKELAHQANTDRVSFYTLDAAGLRVSSSSSVTTMGLTTPGLSSFIDGMHIHNLQSPLQFLAEQTGGKAIINTNDPREDLEEIAVDFGTYYSLGYDPGHAGDGAYHEIEVEVKGAGRKVSVRHREGYRDKSLVARMADGTQSALRFGVEKNPLGIGVDFGRAAPDGDGNFDVPVVIRVPLDEVVLLPRGDSHVARLRLFIAAVDEKGGEAPVAQQSVPIRIPSDQVEQARGETFHYTLTLKMRGGGHKVALGVRDDVGATDSFLSRTVWVGS